MEDAMAFNPAQRSAGSQHTQATRRLMRELRLASLEPSWGVAAAPVSDEDIFTWHCNVAGQPPAGGAPVVLHLELSFAEDYPKRPPKIEVLGSTVTHPNVFSTFICLDMLEGGEWAADVEKRRPYCGWSSAYSVLAILRQLQTFFFEGDGTQWWACSVCTLYNPIKNRRCEACDQQRGQIGEIAIDVSHQPGFRCRCGHTHDGPSHPAFPDPINCDDAPASCPAPEGLPDDACAICLGKLDDAPREVHLHGSPCLRSVAQLSSSAGVAVCDHFFHLPCARQLLVKACPLCRAPFDRVIECTKELASSSCEALHSSSVLHVSARARMAKLARFPISLVARIMTFMRRPERAALAAAVPVWRAAALAPMFWEAQEVQCFHEKIGPDNDIIGIGINSEGRAKLSTLTAHFDAMSLTAWRGGLRNAAWKEPVSHWLPLYIHHMHAEKAAPLLGECLIQLAQCAASGDDSHLPAPLSASLVGANAPETAIHAATVLPELMHQLLKQVVDGDRHASTKLLKGYFVLHRLFLHICDQWPAIREAADASIQWFLAAPENRTKTATPWIVYILQLMTISNYSWDDIKVKFLEEGLARQVQFARLSYSNYRPVDPDAPVEVKPTDDERDADPFSEWELSEEDHGSEKDPGLIGTKRLSPGVWLGRPRGWCCLMAAPRRAGGQHAFSVRLQRLPSDATVRIGWTSGSIGSPFNAWSFYTANGRAFKACPNSETERRRPWERYGRPFAEGDLLTASVSHGVISFRVNDENLGVAYRGAPDAQYRPFLALRRGAEVSILPCTDVDIADLFVTPEQTRNMAWEVRLNRRGYTLILFQVFFLNLVRPGSKGGRPDWEALKFEYDQRLGFPSSKLSDALMAHFAEVHRVISLRGCEAWPLCLQMLGMEDTSDVAIDRLLYAAYRRAEELGYKMPGRHDHA